MFIIGEIGSNFIDLEDCVKSIEISAHCGANAVKFQLASGQELFHCNFDNYEGRFINYTWMPELKYHADKNGIELMCSAFSVKGYEYVHKYVSRHKLASSDNTDPAILEFLGSQNKQVIVSTGSTKIKELEAINKQISNLVFLACEIQYPSDSPELFRIAMLKRWFGIAGYSDHSLSHSRIPSFAANIYGATYYEKHLNCMGYTDTPDAPHSINQHQFKKMVTSLLSPIDPALWEDFIERPTKRYVIATRDIKAGDELTEYNTGTFRIYNFHLYKDYEKIDAINYRKVLGRISSKSYLKGDPINDNG